MSFKIVSPPPTRADEMVLSKEAQSQVEASRGKSNAVSSLREALDGFATTHATLLAAGPQVNRCRLFAHCRGYAQRAVGLAPQLSPEEMTDQTRNDLAQVQNFLNSAGTSALSYLERMRRDSVDHFERGSSGGAQHSPPHQELIGGLFFRRWLAKRSNGSFQ